MIEAEVKRKRVMGVRSMEGAPVLCGNPFPRQDVLSLEGLNLIYLISK